MTLWFSLSHLTPQDHRSKQQEGRAQALPTGFPKAYGWCKQSTHNPSSTSHAVNWAGGRTCRTDSQRSLEICLPDRVRIQTLRLCQRSGTYVLNLWSSLRTRRGQKEQRSCRGRNLEALYSLHRRECASQKVSILYAPRGLFRT